MSEGRSTQHGGVRRATTLAPFQRIYLATLRRRLFARRLFSPAGPGALNHTVATRLALMQRRRYR
ncbi:MAG TPA: hypothetical protein VJ747_08935 [Stellaceae bacterium]|nr:hypothetical protein [Stellaceae bacterium]